jgi:hypothetical protein
VRVTVESIEESHQLLLATRNYLRESSERMGHLTDSCDCGLCVAVQGASTAERAIREWAHLTDVSIGSTAEPQPAIEVYSRPECIYNYCPYTQPTCAEGGCQHPVNKGKS